MRTTKMLAIALVLSPRSAGATTRETETANPAGQLSERWMGPLPWKSTRDLGVEWKTAPP